MQAVGGDDRAAGRGGISVTGLRFAAWLLSALGAGIGGILYVGQLGSTSNITGTGLEFQVYAAMMIGGYSIMRGGVASVIDNALWDLAGRAFNTPVYKLMGGAGREKLKAYASTYPNIGVPRIYAEHALACKTEGYQAYKIHPHYFRNPETGQPTPGRPSNIKADIETCHLVREAVGPDYVLMFDPWGTYMTMEEAIQVGRELEKLNFYWYEHPMPEYRVESYVRLSRELSIPILSPEIIAGGVFSRAEWILRGAGDMSRIDVVRGGITGARKTAIVCEAYGLRCEMHMAGWGNLQVIGATSEDTSEYYENRFVSSMPAASMTLPKPSQKSASLYKRWKNSTASTKSKGIALNIH